METCYSYGHIPDICNHFLGTNVRAHVGNDSLEGDYCDNFFKFGTTTLAKITFIPEINLENI